MVNPARPVRARRFSGSPWGVCGSYVAVTGTPWVAAVPARGGARCRRARPGGWTPSLGTPKGADGLVRAALGRRGGAVEWCPALLLTRLALGEGVGGGAADEGDAVGRGRHGH